jgi:hypothetical protein
VNIIKDYSNWKPVLDYEIESPYIENLNRSWLKHRPPTVPKSIQFDPIPISEFIKLSAREFPNNVCIFDKPNDNLVEMKLMEHPAILEVGVVGVPDPNIGEAVFSIMI